jgi:5-methylcytosine-specific restriction endonuclease McrA
MAKAKKLYLSSAMKARLAGSVRKGRRETIYRMLNKKHGRVPCFVCECHVEEQHATLEHVLPLSHGGTDDMDNLSISHQRCNQRRNNLLEDSPEFLALRVEMAIKHTSRKVKIPQPSK